MKHCSDCGTANINESIWCRRCGSLFDDWDDDSVVKESFPEESLPYVVIDKKQWDMMRCDWKNNKKEFIIVYFVSILLCIWALKYSLIVYEIIIFIHLALLSLRYPKLWIELLGLDIYVNIGGKKVFNSVKAYSFEGLFIPIGIILIMVPIYYLAIRFFHYTVLCFVTIGTVASFIPYLVMFLRSKIYMDYLYYSFVEGYLVVQFVGGSIFWGLMYIGPGHNLPWFIILVIVVCSLLGIVPSLFVDKVNKYSPVDVRIGDYYAYMVIFATIFHILPGLIEFISCYLYGFMV